MPHVTVATVIVDGDNYLMVEERDKSSGVMVFNQPAGHLEAGESLQQAALRETLEETAWEAELLGVLGIALYTAPSNGVTYHRVTFLGRPLQRASGAELDPDIHAVHWMDYEAILANSAKLRSPLTLAAVELHRRGVCYPLELIYSE